MLHSVCDNLVNDQSQRGSELARQRAEGANQLGGHVLARGSKLSGKVELTLNQLVKVNVLSQTLRERLVHGSNRCHAAHRLLQALTRLLRGHAARLQAQQSGHGLQVVLHAVVNFADGRILRHELQLAAAQLGHVTAENHGALTLKAGAPLHQ